MSLRKMSAINYVNVEIIHLVAMGSNFLLT